VAAKISNGRDLVLQLLGELLYVERRLAQGELRELIDAVKDEELQEALRTHLEETKEHVERVETAFRRLEAAPSSNLSHPFDSAQAEHDELAQSIVDSRLADLFHAQAALRTEHVELAYYRGLAELVESDIAELLEPSARSESAAAEALLKAMQRLRA
jgi:ferritin-like metal-binding protein YciE